MSAIVKTVTPFISQEILLKALDAIGCKYHLRENEIVTERVDYYGNQKFVFINGKYQFQHDSSANRKYYQWRKENFKEYQTVNSFLQAVEKEYLRIEQEIMLELERKRMEEELKRMEEQRKAFVEKQKQDVIKKAQEQGYSYQIKQVGNSVKIILTKNTY